MIGIYRSADSLFKHNNIFAGSSTLCFQERTETNGYDIPDVFHHRNAGQTRNTRTDRQTDNKLNTKCGKVQTRYRHSRDFQCDAKYIHRFDKLIQPIRLHLYTASSGHLSSINNLQFISDFRGL